MKENKTKDIEVQGAKEVKKKTKKSVADALKAIKKHIATLDEEKL